MGDLVAPENESAETGRDDLQSLAAKPEFPRFIPKSIRPEIVPCTWTACLWELSRGPKPTGVVGSNALPQIPGRTVSSQILEESVERQDDLTPESADSQS